MLKIQGIDHIVLRTTHSQKMIYFYCDILGCVVEKTKLDIGLIHLRAGNNLIDIVEVKEPLNKENNNLKHFCLRIDNFDYELLREYFLNKSIEIYRYGNRYSSQGYSDSFYLKDPEDNEVELVALKTHRE